MTKGALLSGNKDQYLPHYGWLCATRAHAFELAGWFRRFFSRVQVGQSVWDCLPLSEIAIQQKDGDLAAKICLYAAQNGMQHWSLWLNKIAAFHAAGDYNRCVDAIEESLKIFPKAPWRFGRGLRAMLDQESDQEFDKRIMEVIPNTLSGYHPSTN